MNDLARGSIAQRLRALTPARVGLKRTGQSLTTQDHLDFQRCHAQARDAVHARLNAAALAAELMALSAYPVIRVHSAAMDRASYLQRPDLGRRLEPKSRAQLAPGGWDLALIFADGLSALALERHAVGLLAELLPRLGNWRIAPLVVAEQARVALADEIGEALGARIAVILLGERPGLSSPDSLGAYVTFDPRPGRTDAERNCISNIRAEGLSYSEAARQLTFLLNEARRLELTGVALKAGWHGRGELPAAESR